MGNQKTSYLTAGIGTLNSEKKEYLAGLHDASTEPHTATWISLKLLETLNDIELCLNEVETVTSDGGSNIKSCLADFPTMSWIWCGCHLVHNSTQGVLKQVAYLVRK